MRFEFPGNVVDSIIHQTMPQVQTTDSVNIKIRFRSLVYNEKYARELLLNKTNDSVFIKVAKNQIPVLIKVRGGYLLEITEKSDQTLTLFLNEFKGHNTRMDNKAVDLSHYIKL